MSRNPLSSSVRVATKANDVLEREFARSGAALNAAYLTAQKALTAILPDKGKPTAGQVQEVNMVCTALRNSVRQTTVEALGRGEKVGVAALDRQMRAYRDLIPDVEQRPTGVVTLRQTSTQATTGLVDNQILAIQALILGGASAASVTGGGSREGILRPAPIASAVAVWAAHMAGVAFLDYLTGRQRRGAGEYQKQAIAALDGRTTDCCIKVHGQIQDLGEPFKLIGTPRFSDERDHGPFHWYCRTAMALYQEDYDDGLTDRLLAAARELAEDIAQNLAQDAIQRKPGAREGG